jgi:hypothetical protein
MKYSCDKQQWYLDSFLLGVKLWEECTRKNSYLLEVLICESSSNRKRSRDDIRTQHVCMYMRLCKSCQFVHSVIATKFSYLYWWSLWCVALTPLPTNSFLASDLTLTLTLTHFTSKVTFPNMPMHNKQHNVWCCTQPLASPTEQTSIGHAIHPTSHLAVHTIPNTWQTGSDRPSVPRLIWPLAAHTSNT